MWGPFSIDGFANFENKKLTRFNSRFWNPGSEAVDAFSHNWLGENNWLVPTIGQVSNVICYLLKCSAKGVLIVPKWTSAVFWPLIFNQNLGWRDYVEFHDTNNIFKLGKN